MRAGLRRGLGKEGGRERGREGLGGRHGDIGEGWGGGEGFKSLYIEKACSLSGKLLAQLVPLRQEQNYALWRDNVTSKSLRLFTAYTLSTVSADDCMKHHNGWICASDRHKPCISSPKP